MQLGAGDHAKGWPESEGLLPNQIEPVRLETQDVARPAAGTLSGTTASYTYAFIHGKKVPSRVSAPDGTATAATTSFGNVICATAWPLSER